MQKFVSFFLWRKVQKKQNTRLCFALFTLSEQEQEKSEKENHMRKKVL